MNLSNLKTRSAFLTLKHPLTNKPLKDDNGNLVKIEVVGYDSAQYHKTQSKTMSRYLELKEEMMAAGKSEEQSDEEIKQLIQDELIVELYASCVLGWDDSLNDFFKSEDPEGKGEYSPELVKKLLQDDDLVWFRKQLEDFISNRKYFFPK